MRHVKYTEEVLRPLVASSKTYSEICIKLGNVPSGGNVHHISRRVKAMKLDTSHFIGHRGVANPLGNRGRPWQEVLIVGVPNHRVHGEKLRRALIASGRPHTCEGCGAGQVWQGKPLTLHVDHVDGNPSDNTPENIRFMCPNCHSQTDTFGIRNLKNKQTTGGGTEDAARLDRAVA